MEEKTFRNLQAVAIYLRANYFKVSKSTVYDHAKQRKIMPRNDGFYYLTDVEVYAANHLKSNKMSTPAATDSIQRRRNEAEARKMEAQAKHWEVKAQIAAGNYVDRSIFERELSHRAMTFKNDLEALARTKSQEICQLVKGQDEFIPDLTEYLLEQFALFLHRYSEDKEFIVPANLDTIQDDNLKNDTEIDESNAEFLEDE